MELSIALILVLAFQAILFVQSGLDKVFDFKGNMDWLLGHFSKSPLAPVTKPMVVAITLLELATGAMSILAAVYLVSESPEGKMMAMYALVLAGVSYLSLFFGQRVAKDYAGAASIPAYFIVTLLGFFLVALG